MSQLRITPEEVIAAYKETGAIPTRCVIRSIYKEKVHCCAMGVLALQANVDKEIAYDWLEEQYGVRYSHEFQVGFDSNIRYGESIGHQDGRAVRDALIQQNMLKV